MTTVVDNFDLLLRGLGVTLQLSFWIVLFGTAIGLLGGIGLLFGPLPLRLLLRGYVDVVRGTPLLVLIFLIFYGLPAFGIEVDGFQAAVAALSLFAGAHIAEIVRGGVSAVPRGQTDAGKSLGLTFWPRLRHVVLPLALPAMLPPWINTVVEMVKGSSLAYLVSVTDLLFSTQMVLERTGQAMPMYLAAAMLYVGVNLTISRLGHLLEGRLRRGT